ncbi:uncharacterized protein LOC127865296 [Dreissena polymorpha]|uniref:uncharacterized protein LOC127865296 n=1 Tax=Dreissena polymorpha TaxID=45954 RepID=UPI00226512BC|nr:uncharacterized protein LOC127865296 [Dreissena polymorpha]
MYADGAVGNLKYSIVSQHPNGHFYVDGFGNIRCNETALRRNCKSIYSLTFSATDDVATIKLTETVPIKVYGLPNECTLTTLTEPTATTTAVTTTAQCECDCDYDDASTFEEPRRKKQPKGNMGKNVQRDLELSSLSAEMDD